jgi:DNA-binding CsgD family transcriptional regulator
MSIAIPERRIADRHLYIVGQLIPHIHEMLAHTTTDKIHLTVRELEVLRWVAAGKTNWEIGVILAMAERTVKFHLANVFAKLGTFSRSHAIAKAVRLGLVSF